jgi:hypothetical protein
MSLRTCGVVSSQKGLGPQITKSQSTIPQITKRLSPQVPHLRKVRKYNKIYKSANFRICDLQNLFADRPCTFA